eukprot:COSAG01_NODE_11648_length_1887_cov_1.855226_1_plen_118_part_00
MAEFEDLPPIFLDVNFDVNVPEFDAQKFILQKEILNESTQNFSLLSKRFAENEQLDVDCQHKRRKLDRKAFLARRSRMKKKLKISFLSDQVDDLKTQIRHMRNQLKYEKKKERAFFS